MNKGVLNCGDGYKFIEFCKISYFSTASVFSIPGNYNLTFVEQKIGSIS